jgi:CDP-glycerol glycerophosphotransferase
MDLGRLALLAFARVLRLLLLVTPRRRHVFVASWPSDEGNAVETVRALTRRYGGAVVWADAPTDERLRHLGLDPAQVVAKPKNSLSALWSFLTAEATFFTHGLYGCPRPVRSKAIINLWHGDGVKVTAGARIYSTYLVTSSTVLALPRVRHFRVAPQNLLTTGLPRVEQLRRPSSSGQLAALGIDPDRPFAVWMPTYRQAGGAGLNGSFVDTADVAVDAEIARTIAPGLACLQAQGIQIVVKPHPLDAMSRSDPGFVLITDSAIREAGTTLYHVLGASAGLLTDYSSVWTDYLALDRPIGFFMPDLQGYLSGRGIEPADSMEHLPGPFLRTVADFEHLGVEMLGKELEPGSSLRRSAREHFGLVHPHSPADELLTALIERGVLVAADEQKG